MLRTAFRWIMAAFYVVAGLNHFRDPRLYLELMPPSLPWPMALIYLSGVAEVAGGLGILIRPIRRAAGWGLILLLIAIFPANIHIALHGFHGLPGWILWGRLPLQGALIAWVYWTCLAGRRHGPADRPNVASSDRGS